MCRGRRRHWRGGRRDRPLCSAVRRPAGDGQERVLMNSWFGAVQSWAVAAIPTPGARGRPRSPAGLPVRPAHSLVVTVTAHLCATPACFSSRSSGLRSGAGLQPGPESVRRRPAQTLCPSAGADDKHLLHCAINDDEARPDVRPKVRFRCAEAASPASCAALVRKPPARADSTARVRGNDRSASW